MLGEVETAITAIADAMQALGDQKTHLERAQTEHALAWEAENARLEQEQLKGLRELEELCKAKAPPQASSQVQPALPVSGQDTVEAEQLKLAVSQLQQAMALQQNEFAAQKEMAEKQYAALQQELANVQASATLLAASTAQSHAGGKVVWQGGVGVVSVACDPGAAVWTDSTHGVSTLTSEAGKGTGKGARMNADPW